MIDRRYVMLCEVVIRKGLRWKEVDYATLP
jgi:hypothetical protein